MCLTLVYNVGVLQYLGREFVTSNGLNKGCSEIVLKNEGGGRWTLPLKHYKSINHTYLGPGWTTFCQVNGIKAEDAFMFKLVRTREKPVLCLCPEESSHRDKTPVECLEDSDDVNPLSSSSKSKESKEESLGDKRASSSYSEDRFLTLTLTQKAVKRYQLVKIINKSALRLSVILVIFSAKIKSLCSFFRWVSRRGMASTSQGR